MALISPEQFAQLQLAERLNSMRGEISPEVAAGSVIGQEKIQQGYKKFSDSGIPTTLRGRAGMIGSGAAGLGVVANQLGQSQPLGAVASLGGSALGGKIGAGLGEIGRAHV